MATKRTWTVQSLYLAYGVAPLVILSFLFSLFTFYDASPTASNYFKTAVTLTKQIAPAIETQLYTKDQDSLGRQLEGFIEDQRISQLRVLDAQDTELFVFNRDDSKTGYLHKSNLMKSEVMPSNHGSSNTFKRDVKLDESDFILGRLEIGLEEQGKSLAQFFNSSLLVVFAVIMLIAWMASRFIEGRVLEPIEHIKQWSNREGNNTPFTPIATEIEELDSLQEAFTKMVGDLASKNAQIQYGTQHSSETQQTLVERIATQGLFLERITHELRSPLNGVYGMLQLLSDNPEPTMEAEYVNIAKTSTEKLMTVTDQIRDFINLENGALHIEPRHVSLPDVIKSIYLLFTDEANAKGLKYAISVQGDKEPILAYADDSRIKQILYDLLKNAVTHTEHGEVRISTTMTVSNHLQMEVAIDDSGTTIPDSQFKHVLDPVKSFSLKGDNRFGPFILRLININKLVMLLGGTFSVSQSNFGGVRFVLNLTFPYRTVTAQVVSKAPVIDHPAAKILLVEDNPVSQKVAQALLAKLNMECDIASNGKQAVNLHQSDMYDVIFMDCQMPVMDGYEATRRIRKHEQDQRNPRTPIIALTADALPGVEERCLEAGMDAYITKPVTKERLIQMIERYTTTQESTQRV